MGMKMPGGVNGAVEFEPDGMREPLKAPKQVFCVVLGIGVNGAVEFEPDGMREPLKASKQVFCMVLGICPCMKRSLQCCKNSRCALHRVS